MASDLFLLKCGKSGSNAPSVPVSGSTLWYDATQESYANNDPVGTITDRSGNGYNATAALTLRPTFKTAIQNGKSAYLFDGVDDVAITTATLSNIIANNAYSLFCVFNAAAIDTDAANSWSNDAIISDAGQNGVLVLRSSSGVGAFNYDGTDSKVSSVISTGTPYIVHTRHESGNLYISKNAGSETSTPSGNTTSLISVLNIGAGQPNAGKYFDGYIMEILVYNTALSASDIAANYAYLNTKWGVY